ncbi:hypothetical protein BO70DRAFT_362093 [Aspergillus heteromorphus CBS 117.55]|uniref:Uncharacterized protein n=1 Tax=Aspergillus heteromorphus CBS 117.55 TaxID=1448321 RepID=A0A317W6E1_9EURO|nr:uncharacterized protein BO70DRAFT_362093 [Aspergillus heteromorphus CBS 117.55]PWY82184.1 hypothetical protein BO70DRAFT_362093 [Aspergillus heteromorphus CBS 117.55]
MELGRNTPVVALALALAWRLVAVISRLISTYEQNFSSCPLPLVFTAFGGSYEYLHTITYQIDHVHFLLSMM